MSPVFHHMWTYAAILRELWYALTDSAALDQKQVMDELTKLMASFTPEQLKALQNCRHNPNNFPQTIFFIT